MKLAILCLKLGMLPTMPRRWLPQGAMSIVPVTLKELHISLYERRVLRRHLLYFFFSTVTKMKAV
jgi:hypothetical protein